MVDPQDRSGRTAATLTLTVLTVINFLNYIDRYVLSAVVEGIRADFAVSDSGAGLLGSMFIIVYTLASPFIGYMGDRVVRKRVVAVGVALWSLATVASGMAQNYEQLLATRAFVGIGEAAYATVAPAIIADLYSEDRRGRMLAYFYLAIPVGSALGYILGGLASSSSETILAVVGLAGQGIAGWRVAFLIAGGPGLLFALLALFMFEPERGAMDDPEDRREVFHRPIDAVRRLVSTPAWRINTAGLTLMTFSMGGLAFWMPSFLQRVHGMDEGSAGLVFGGVTVVAGLLATLTGGVLGDRAYARRKGGYFSLSGWGLLLGAPCAVVVVLVHQKLGVFAFAFLAEFFLFLNTGPLNAALVGCVPARLRATAVAANVLVIHALGDAVSPLIMGAVSDITSAWTGNEGLGLRVAVGMTAIPIAVGAWVLLRGAKRVDASDAGLRSLDGLDARLFGPARVPAATDAENQPEQ